VYRLRHICPITHGVEIDFTWEAVKYLNRSVRGKHEQGTNAL